MTTNVYLITLAVVDHDDIGLDSVRDVLQHTKYPNRCISPMVLAAESRSTEWSDDHPLNRESTLRQEISRLFGKSV